MKKTFDFLNICFFLKWIQYCRQPFIPRHTSRYRQTLYYDLLKQPINNNFSSCVIAIDFHLLSQDVALERNTWAAHFLWERAGIASCCRFSASWGKGRGWWWKWRCECSERHSPFGKFCSRRKRLLYTF